MPGDHQGHRKEPTAAENLPYLSSSPVETGAGRGAGGPLRAAMCFKVEKEAWGPDPARIPRRESLNLTEIFFV